MHHIIIDQPYEFAPPDCGPFMAGVMRQRPARYVRRTHGIEAVHIEGLLDLNAPLAAGHGVLLADLYLVRQLALYPPDYIASRPTRERVLETVERFEEDLTDGARLPGPWTARVQIRTAHEVAAAAEIAAVLVLRAHY